MEEPGQHRQGNRAHQEQRVTAIALPLVAQLPSERAQGMAQRERRQFRE
jgi:hypothetical protein